MYSARSVQRNFVCNRTAIPGEGDDDGHAGFLAHVFWVFFAQKFWEFLDTWFFLLRMSFRQVTFLHIFHHCSINIVVGMIIPFEFKGDMYLPILLNAFVHVLMYTHYLVSALGGSTPWKPYLTSLQLGQFVLIATQSAMSLSSGDGCGAPYFAKIAMVAYMASMILLFGNFFFHSYVLKNSKMPLGSGVIKEQGHAKVELPSTFAAGDIHYQVTPIGRPMP